jgi:hypothetical protein
MITSHAITMLLLHQCFIYTHFDGTTGPAVLFARGKMGAFLCEKKMHDVNVRLSRLSPEPKLQHAVEKKNNSDERRSPGVCCVGGGVGLRGGPSGGCGT